MSEPTLATQTAALLNTKVLLVGIACGLGAALCWALGFVATRHGLKVGFTPVDLLVHRFLWSGLAFVPLVLHAGIRNLCGIGWARGLAFMVLGGPVFSLISYAGFTLVPLGHGSVIQPSCATLGGLIFAVVLLREKVSLSRVVGAAIIVIGLLVIGGESIGHMKSSAVVGDLMFVLAGLMFAGFATLVRYWRVSALSVASVISVLSLALFPLYLPWNGFVRAEAIGFKENAIQAVGQGILAGPAAMYLFTLSIQRLGVARAAVLPATVPVLTVLLGWLLIGEPPTALQAMGLVIVLAGFYLAQRPG